MGHIGVKGLQHAIKGINFNDFSYDSCTICARANIKHKPFPQQATHRTTHLLERIHCDVNGPLPSSYGNYKYFILFICCYFQYISVYFMKSCEEALECFIKFRKTAETFCGQKITILRVDNVPKLIKGKFMLHCESKGVRVRSAAGIRDYEPDSPHQMGQMKESDFRWHCDLMA